MNFTLRETFYLLMKSMYLRMNEIIKSKFVKHTQVNYGNNEVNETIEIS